MYLVAVKEFSTSVSSVLFYYMQYQLPASYAKLLAVEL